MPDRPSFSRLLPLSWIIACLLASVVPKPAHAQPQCQIYGPTSGCGSVAICGPGGEYTWEWFGPDGAQFSTARCVLVSVTGMYGLVVRDWTGSASERCQQFVTIDQAPSCAIEGPGRVCEGESARLCGPMGDFLYAWSGPAGFQASARCVDALVSGTYVLVVRRAGDDCGPRRCTHDVVVEPCHFNQPPDCSGAVAHADLWPPDHALVPVRIEGVLDPDGDPVTITVTAVTQSEAVNGQGDGDQWPDARIDAGAARVRRERGQGTGRVYEISFLARDEQGGECPGRVTLCVPQSQGNKSCEDSGNRFDSLATPAPGPGKKNDVKAGGRRP